MFSQGHIALWSVGYLCVLFVIAWWGDRLREGSIRRYRPIILSLAVAVYCGAWAFHGLSSQALAKGWYFPPTFLGAIILLVFFAPLLRKVIAESKRGNVSSIADYLGRSFGRSRALAVIVSLVFILLLVPYIALQIKALTQNYHLLVSVKPWSGAGMHKIWQFDTALLFALVLGFSAMLMGSRYNSSREHHNGLMLVAAFDGLIKIVVLLVLSIFVATVMFDGLEDIFLRLAQNEVLVAGMELRRNDGHGYLSAVMLGAVAILCLPRQFHVLVTESEKTSDLDTVRWLFPSYLLVLGVCTLLLAYAGMQIFAGQGVSADQYVLGLPVIAGRSDLALLGYIGGFSAASTMVILACVAMSSMLCDELVVPILARAKWFDGRKKNDVNKVLRNIRRWIILFLVLSAYLYYKFLASQAELGDIGLLSFSLLVLFIPAVLFSVILKPDRRVALAHGVIAGIGAGFVLWCYTIFIPTLVACEVLPASLLSEGPFAISWLRPTGLFGLQGFSDLSHGLFWSLLANLSGFFCCLKKPLSFFREASFRETRVVTALELRTLLSRFLGGEQAELALKKYPSLAAARGYASDEDVGVVKNILAGVLGPVSAEEVMDKSFTGDEGNEILLDKASKIFQFGRELLIESIDNINLGISVVDSQLRLVAWNRSYLDIFEYPQGMVHVGCDVAGLIRYNAQENCLAAEEIERYTEKRLKLMVSGSAYIHTYVHYTGRVLEIQGAAMGEGGYVTTFTDITNYQDTVTTLEETRATLETRVRERTEELQLANRKLREANHTKTHFLAAAGHDLIQPLNAAKLFATALTHKVRDPETTKLINSLDHSLHSADAIISELLAIAKLDSGEMKVNEKTFCIGELLHSLHKEFSIIALKKNIELRFCFSSLAVTSDENLLKRILQNLLSNAIRYTKSGKVLIGCRRSKTSTYIEVWDQGKGIPELEQEDIFKEFHRLDKSEQDGGLGLGLATVQRLCQLLEFKIKVASTVGKGSVFRLVVARSEKGYVSAFEGDELTAPRESVLAGMKVLCIDNESTILEGMQAVLETWGCIFHGATEWQEGRQEQAPWEPDALLVDYHLNDDVTGIELAEKFRNQYGQDKPIVVISADQNNDVRTQAKSRAYFFLRKPLKAASLWSVLARINSMKSLEGTVVNRQ